VTDESMADLRTLLEETYSGQERLSRDEIVRRAVAANISPADMARLDALPEGEYAEDEAIEALRQLPAV
jgi:hypothetical protein